MKTIKEDRNSKIEHQYQHVDKKSDISGKIPTDIQYENNKQRMQIKITETDDIKPLLGMDGMKKFNLSIRNIRTDEINQTERIRVIEKFPDLFKTNTTIRDTEINVQIKQGHYRVKQKARPNIKFLYFNTFVRRSQ